MNNFYTSTVYEKGAELIRMMHTLLGPEAYRRGMDLYFERHDGKAVTCDDFVAAMEDAGGVDLGQFRRWYSQAGTPVLTTKGRYDAASRCYELEIAQSTPPTPGQAEKLPLHIPVAMGLLDPSGREIPLRLENEAKPAGAKRVLELKAERETYRFVDVPAAPVPSLLRGFSAPVQLESELAPEELGFLMAHDTDSFNRWEASQQLGTIILLGSIAALGDMSREVPDPQALVDAYRAILENEALDPALAARALVLPAERTLSERLEEVNPEHVHGARSALRATLARELADLFAGTYERLNDGGSYDIDPASMGRRSLKNVCLGYLARLEEQEQIDRIVAQYEGADNMSDASAALGIISDLDCPERDDLLARFYETWRDEALVLNKWLGIQARSPSAGSSERILDLMEHEVFDIKNPNRVRALLGAFAFGNLLRFHESDGAGYRLVADQILVLDGLNPQVAASLARAFNRWRKMEADRRGLMQAELSRVLAAPKLSPNVYEIVSKALQEEVAEV
jgi:aminopeptidase N